MNDIEQKLSRIDLNLLISLSVLLKEKNVSRAAASLYLSQSAMSRTLQRLRELFDDPLFHRSSRGIIPTVRAKELEQMLPDLLGSLENIIEERTFDAKTSNKSFTISVPPLLSQSITLPLVKLLAKDAPNIRIIEQPTIVAPLPLLELGSLDFSIHITPPNDDNFDALYIGQLTPVIFARTSHPLFKNKQVTIEDCLNYNFIELLIESATGAHIDNPLFELLYSGDKKKRTVLSSSQMHILLEVLNNSDSLMIANDMFLQHNDLYKKIAPIYQFELPKNKKISLYLLSHKRIRNSGAHQWLKEVMINNVLISK